jgi:hypothetical protein
VYIDAIPTTSTEKYRQEVQPAPPLAATQPMGFPQPAKSLSVPFVRLQGPGSSTRRSPIIFSKLFAESSRAFC